MALTDISTGDGGTMIIPGSHKSNFSHPHFDQYRMNSEGASVEGIEGAVEMHMEKGDAIVFVDGLSHGSAKRTNPGERRVIIYRYGPSWGNFRHGYQPSQELLARLTPERRKIVQPLELLPREPQVEGR